MYNIYCKAASACELRLFRNTISHFVYHVVRYPRHTIDAAQSTSRVHQCMAKSYYVYIPFPTLYVWVCVCVKLAESRFVTLLSLSTGWVGFLCFFLNTPRDSKLHEFWLIHSFRYILIHFVKIANARYPLRGIFPLSISMYLSTYVMRNSPVRSR